MAFTAGDEVLDIESGWVGTVVKRRLDEDTYMVRFERYVGGAGLQLLSEAGKPSSDNWWAPERTAEIERLTLLLKQDLDQGRMPSNETLESMSKLGLVAKS